MKIISNNELYVQGNDLEYLLYDENVSLYNRHNILSLLKITNYDEYIKIENPDLIECILYNKDILNFFVYYRTPISELIYKALELKADIDNLEQWTDSDIYDKELKKEKYILNQIGQIIAYKKKESKCNLPNIPNPSSFSIRSEKLGAALSLDYDNVLIYNLNGEPISDEVDKQFCDAAYLLLMHDNFPEIDEEFINLQTNISEDRKYLSISKVKEKSNKRNYKKRN